MRIGMCASLPLSFRHRDQLNLFENVYALAGKQGDYRLLPGSFLAVYPTTSTPNRARSARALDVHCVNGLDPHVEELLDRFSDLDLVCDRRNLKRVLILFHEVGVLLGDQRPDNDLVDCQRWHLGLPCPGDGAVRPPRHSLLFPGTRFTSIFGKPPQQFHGRDRFARDQHAIELQNVSNIQISRVDNPNVRQVAGRLPDRFHLTISHNEHRATLRQGREDLLHRLRLWLDLGKPGNDGQSLIAHFRRERRANRKAPHLSRHVLVERPLVWSPNDTAAGPLWRADRALARASSSFLPPWLGTTAADLAPGLGIPRAEPRVG